MLLRVISFTKDSNLTHGLEHGVIVPKIVCIQPQLRHVPGMIAL